MAPGFVLFLVQYVIKWRLWILEVAKEEVIVKAAHQRICDVRISTRIDVLPLYFSSEFVKLHSYRPKMLLIGDMSRKGEKCAVEGVRSSVLHYVQAKGVVCQGVKVLSADTFCYKQRSVHLHHADRFTRR